MIFRKSQMGRMVWMARIAPGKPAWIDPRTGQVIHGRFDGNLLMIVGHGESTPAAL